MQRIGKAAYKLDLSRGCNRQALRSIHDIFHMSLLRLNHNDRLGTDIPPTEVDGKVDFEIEKTLKHRSIRGDA